VDRSDNLNKHFLKLSKKNIAFAAVNMVVPCLPLLIFYLHLHRFAQTFYLDSSMKFILLFSFLTSTAALNCSAGLNASSNLATQTLPATLAQVLTIVGSFFNSSWYENPGNLTIGPDNTAGSMRTFLGFMTPNVYNETLLVYILNATFFEQSWMGPGSYGTYVSFLGFVLGSYVETLTVQSTCSGSAVIVNFGSQFCATNLSTATPMLLGNHVYGIGQIQSLLNISNFTGCTTSASSIKAINLFIVVLSAILGLHLMIL
jgi:hypothetical protein